MEGKMYLGGTRDRESGIVTMALEGPLHDLIKKGRWRTKIDRRCENLELQSNDGEGGWYKEMDGDNYDTMDPANRQNTEW